jgi:two-component system sensor histidine kinase UhpB
MKLRTRLNLVVAGLTATFVAVLLVAEFQSARASIREEIETANRVAAQLLGRLASIYSREGGTELVLHFLAQLGRVRANDIILRSAMGEVLYRSPPVTYKARRSAPEWFSRLLAPSVARHTFLLPGGSQLVVQPEVSRAVIDAWDHVLRLLALSAVMLLVANGLAFWLIHRALSPFPVIVRGLERIESGDLAFRLPPLAGYEAHAIGAAFNRMAQAVEDKVRAERKAHEAEARLEERRELSRVVEQRLEEERRLIAHELHDEFGQSVTAIRSLAQVIATQGGRKDPATGEAAKLISEEAARLYDNMHGLIPRLTPLSLDSLGLAATLESLVRDWQRRYPSVTLSLEQNVPDDLGPSVALALYRVVQEGLINALRHAQPSRVEIKLESAEGRIVVTVLDNGTGLPQDWSRPGHFGLRGLAERIEHLGGTFSVGNRPEGGAQLTATVPLGVGS